MLSSTVYSQVISRQNRGRTPKTGATRAAIVIQLSRCPHSWQRSTGLLFGPQARLIVQLRPDNGRPSRVRRDRKTPNSVLCRSVCLQQINSCSKNEPSSRINELHNPLETPRLTEPRQNLLFRGFKKSNSIFFDN